MNTCNICRKTYSTTSTLKRHQKTTKIHEKNSIVVLQSYFRKNLTKLPVKKLPTLPVEILNDIFIHASEDVFEFDLISKYFYKANIEERNTVLGNILCETIIEDVFDFVSTKIFKKQLNNRGYSHLDSALEEYSITIKRFIENKYRNVLLVEVGDDIESFLRYISPTIFTYDDMIDKYRTKERDFGF